MIFMETVVQSLDLQGFLADGEPMKTARQARSRETQKNLIAAAEQIIREEGAKGLKVDQLTRIADCSTGSFYNLFKDRNAIILAVMRDFKERTLTRIKEGFRPENNVTSKPEDIFTLMVEFSMDVYSQNSSLFRVTQTLHLELPELKDIGNEVVNETVTLLTQIPCLSHVDPCYLECIVRINIATFDHYMFFKSGEVVDKDKVKVAMVRMMGSILDLPSS